MIRKIRKKIRRKMRKKLRQNCRGCGRMFLDFYSEDAMKKRAMLFIDEVNLANYYSDFLNEKVEFYNLEELIEYIKKENEEYDFVDVYLYMTRSLVSKYINKKNELFSKSDKWKNKYGRTASHIQKEYIRCKHCGQAFKHEKVKIVDKGTDINLAVDVLHHAYRDNYDAAFIFSNDTDFLGLIKEVKSIGKEINVCAFDINENEINRLYGFYDNVFLLKDVDYLRTLISTVEYEKRRIKKIELLNEEKALLDKEKIDLEEYIKNTEIYKLKKDVGVDILKETEEKIKKEKHIPFEDPMMEKIRFCHKIADQSSFLAYRMYNEIMKYYEMNIRLDEPDEPEGWDQIAFRRYMRQYFGIDIDKLMQRKKPGC